MTEPNQRLLIITITLFGFLIAFSAAIGNKQNEEFVLVVFFIVVVVIILVALTNPADDEKRKIKQLVSHNDDLYARCNDGTVMRKEKQGMTKQTTRTGWVEIEGYPHLADPEAN